MWGAGIEQESWSTWGAGTGRGRGAGFALGWRGSRRGGGGRGGWGGGWGRVRQDVLVVEAQRKLTERGVGEVSVVEMFQYPTVSALAKRMTNGKDDLEKQRAKLQQQRKVDRSDSIAIIGMAGRFPGAVDISEFWQN